MPSSKIKKSNNSKSINNTLSSADNNGNSQTKNNIQPIQQITNTLLQNGQIKDLLNKNISKLSKNFKKGSDDVFANEELKSLIEELVQQNLHQFSNVETSQHQAKSCLKASNQSSASSKNVNFNLKNNEYFAIPGRDTEEYKMERGSDDEFEEDEYGDEEEMEYVDDIDVDNQTEEMLYTEQDSSYATNYNDDYSGEEENDDLYESSESSQLELQSNDQQSSQINSNLVSKRQMDSNDNVQRSTQSRNGSSPQKRFKSTIDVSTKAYSSANDITRLNTLAVDKEVIDNLKKEIKQAQSENKELEKEIELYKELIQAQLDSEEKFRIAHANKQLLEETNKLMRNSLKELSRIKRINVKGLISTHSNRVEAIISDPSTSQLPKLSLLDTFIQQISSNEPGFDHFPQLAFRRHSKRDIVSRPTTDPFYKLYIGLTNLEIDSLVPVDADIAGELAPDDHNRIASHVYQCSLKIPEDKRFSFLIYLFLKDSQYREEYAIYYPMLTDSNKKLMNELPSYLRQDIMFKTKELTNFLRKMLDHFYKPRK
ncbi:hypothetical protein CONCODRAFT_3968 [Conidiobolus coronatus NRRL 28638]|uniref:Monopolin complex subunit Csm1/Pcs1 C-terminal domain-containing protein n=1 Tax=Conidiobolus coronatus (strain ATCC 28846 / CBS 209.66 / NRRL 28638) TaxID=796925 RepID=A0A137PDJ6_CONC2|nr:hypothetical protein CONCODRAFT_3968 [Conidiobolus coronatus NRRL 28638]|eukprot:KXN73084.1 hypothetical protein CONCODRAFT_3968 [Conidiobolus coronatus NRRL 28638]